MMHSFHRDVHIQPLNEKAPQHPTRTSSDGRAEKSKQKVVPFFLSFFFLHSSLTFLFSMPSLSCRLLLGLSFLLIRSLRALAYDIVHSCIISFANLFPQDRATGTLLVSFRLISSPLLRCQRGILSSVFCHFSRWSQCSFQCDFHFHHPLQQMSIHRQGPFSPVIRACRSGILPVFLQAPCRLYSEPIVTLQEKPPVDSPSELHRPSVVSIRGLQYSLIFSCRFPLLT